MDIFYIFQYFLLHFPIYSCNKGGVNRYIKRICDQKIKEMLEISGAIWIQGPKWCGKSTKTKTFSKSNIELQNNQTLELIKLQISNNSNHFLEKATPILIDEWQEIPEI